MKLTKNIIAFLLFAAPTLGWSQHNPVLKGVADAGVIRYAGKYYLGGVATYGDFYVSDDLMHWNSRVHVFDLDNNWTHGTGAKNNQVHADDISYSNGLFHLLFSVNYWGDDRHIVHITHATSPSVTDPFKEVRNDQWFENRIDPMVFIDEDGKKYLYMVKFTDGNTIWGRQLNDDFSFAGDAVQQFSSQPGTWETLDNRVAEGPFVINYRNRYYMMYNANHTAPEYGHYRLGVCEAASPLAFNPGGKYSHPVVEPNTQVIEDENVDLLRFGSGSYVPININKASSEFSLEQMPTGNVYMKIIQRGGCEVAINGTAINAGAKSDFKMYKINKNILHSGINTLTITKGSSPRSSVTDLALYDLAEDSVDDLLVTPGQPNIVRGPNGWEWWLVYMANNGWERDQYVDRIHFVNNRLTVDGITGPHTSGYHPQPSKPAYCGHSLDSVPASKAYLLELTFKNSDIHQGVKIGSKNVSLPSSMQVGVNHVWRVEKNYDKLSVWIDNVAVVSNGIIDTSADASLSWIGKASDYDVEYISFTDGWDEYANRFSGWSCGSVSDKGLLLSDGDSFKGECSCNYSFSSLLTSTSKNEGRYGIYAAYIDSDNYVQMSISPSTGKLITEHCEKGKTKIIETELDTTEVSYPDIKYTDSYEKQYRFDSPTEVKTIMLPRLDADNDSYAENLNLSSNLEKTYHKDMYALQQVSWLDGDTWRPLVVKSSDGGNAMWQNVDVQPVTTKALRFINANPRDNNRNIYRIKVKTGVKEAYQMRVERCGNDIHLFLDNREISVLKLRKNLPSRIGFHCEASQSVSVGNTLYYGIYR